MIQSLNARFRALSAGVVGAAAILAAPLALSDSIAPSSFSADLGVGESVTIRKTVTVSAGSPDSAVLDVMFVFDTTGSMGGAINTAKTAANGILAGLAGFGSLQSGVGFYNDPGAGVTSNLSASTVPTVNAINALSASGGGDYPELGYDGIALAANDATWRAGSSRLIIAFGDAGFKNGLFNQGTTAAAMAAAGVSLLGLDYCSFSFTCELAPTFKSAVEGLGGTVFAGTTDPDLIVDLIKDAVGGSFANYGTVTVSDLGAGLPEIGVSTVCVSADIGACVGADAVGKYDRSIERTFEFDVTFTRLVDGPTSFDTHALVDRGIVASERDTFGAVPEPGSLALLGMGLLGLGAARRRKH